MKKIAKKLTALLLTVVMLFVMAPTAFAGVEQSVEEAYEECAALYPEFVDAIKAQNVTDAQIIAFLESMQKYMLDLDIEVTEENFEEHLFDSVNYAINLRRNIPVRDALVNAFPDAVLDGMEGVINPKFEPLVETIKVILFGGNEEPTEPEEKPTKPEVTPTEPEEKPTEPEVTPTEPEEKPTVPEEKPTKPSNGGPSGPSNDGGDEPAEKPTEPAKKPTFSDMTQAAWAENAVEALVKMGVINGYPDGTFKPNNLVTRSEFSKIIVLTSGRYSVDKNKYESNFTDVPKDRWDYTYVSAAYMYGFITGRSAAIFDPNSNITRADLCLIVYRYIKSVNPEFKAKTDANGQVVMFKDAANVPSWTKEAVEALYSNGIAPVRDTVNNKFEPTLPATRAECAYIVHNAINAALNIKK